MVRAKILNEIQESLKESGSFTSLDFEHDPGVAGKGYTGDIVQLTVTYRHKREFSFSASIPNSSNGEGLYIFEVIFTPGIIALEEKIRYRSLDSFMEGIVSWTKRIDEELLADPIVRKIDSLDRKIKNILSKIDEMDNSPFTEDEMNKYEHVIKDFEEQLNDKISSIDAEHQERYEKLKKELSELRDSLRIIEKKQWLKKAATKIVAWSSQPENQKIMKSIGSTVMKMLPIETPE